MIDVIFLKYWMRVVLDEGWLVRWSSVTLNSREFNNIRLIDLFNKKNCIYYRCYEAEQKRDDRERHPINQKDKHPLFRVSYYAWVILSLLLWWVKHNKYASFVLANCFVFFPWWSSLRSPMCQMTQRTKMRFLRVNFLTPDRPS